MGHKLFEFLFVLFGVDFGKYRDKGLGKRPFGKEAT